MALATSLNDLWLDYTEEFDWKPAPTVSPFLERLLVSSSTPWPGSAAKSHVGGCRRTHIRPSLPDC